MRELDKSKRYNLEYLTVDEKEQVFNYLKEFSEWKDFNVDDFKKELYKGIYFNHEYGFWLMTNNGLNTNAKELFYTLENIQVDCRELSEEQIENMCEVFIKNGYDYYNSRSYALKIFGKCFFIQCYDDGFLLDSKSDDKTTITYEKFMELFSNKEENFKKLVEVLNEELTEEAERQITLKDLEKTQVNSDVDFYTINKQKPKQYQPHYNNENGSLYKIATDLGLNHWEFDIFKRLVRCRKKNQFKEDLQKIKDTIDIYLNEFTSEK